MAQLIRKKITASTLIETLIAMVVIMVVFAIAMRLFNQVMYSGVSLKKIQVQQQLHFFCKKVQKEGYLKIEHLTLEGVDYDFTTDTTAIGGLSKLAITAKQDGKIIGLTKCLFKVKEVDFEN